jgi:hypothetical protein
MKSSLTVNTTLSFGIVNLSEKPIIGYSLAFILTLPDGKKLTKTDVQDFTIHSVQPIPNVYGWMVTPTGPLLPGKIQERTALLWNDLMPVKITPVVVAVVFEDNSVLGDVKQAKRDFFKPHEAIAAELKWYLNILSKAEIANDYQRTLDRLIQTFGVASSETKYPVKFSRIALSYDELLAARWPASGAVK